MGETTAYGSLPKGSLPVSDHTISVSDWANDSSLSLESRRNRKYAIRVFEKANHASMAQILDDIRGGKLSVYSACKAFVDGIRKDHAPYTVYVYRSHLPSLFQSVLGESAFSRTVFDRLVRYESPYVVHLKKVPTRPEIISLLKVAYPQYRALIGVLACTGMRIGEVLTRKWSDTDIRTDGHARVGLKAGETKARYARYCFLTRECMDWLKVQKESYPSEYWFAGENHEHLQYTACQHVIKRLFQRIGLKDSPDRSEIFSVHSLRTFAGDEMRACGLREKNVLAIVGHRNQLGAESHYIDWNRVESEWVETCANKMCFLSEKLKDYEQAKEENADLKELLKVLLERITVSPSTKHKPDPELRFTPLGAENNLYLPGMAYDY